MATAMLVGILSDIKYAVCDGDTDLRESWREGRSIIWRDLLPFLWRYKAKQRCVMGIGMCLYAQLVQTKHKQCKIIAAVSRLALRGRRPTSCNMSSTRQHELSRTRASSTGDSLISGEVSYTGWMLSTGFGSEFASRCSDVCTRWLLNTCLPTANPSPASLAVATCV